MTDTQPNPWRVAWSVWRATRVRRPRPAGSASFDHSGFQPVLDALARHGVDTLAGAADASSRYLTQLEAADPDDLNRDEALAFWVNGYNAGALRLAGKAQAAGAASVLDLTNGFDQPVMTVAGEALTLNQIEHGKVRRFGDPRIHFGLVCGSLSCPTLAAEPFRGPVIDDQLDRRARQFLAAGGAQADEPAATLSLSRILLWYGADFVRPHRIARVAAGHAARVVKAVTEWLDADVKAWIDETQPAVRFLPYDWSLGCSIR